MKDCDSPVKWLFGKRSSTSSKPLRLVGGGRGWLTRNKVNYYFNMSTGMPPLSQNRVAPIRLIPTLSHPFYSGGKWNRFWYVLSFIPLRLLNSLNTIPKTTKEYLLGYVLSRNTIVFAVAVNRKIRGVFGNNVVLRSKDKLLRVELWPHKAVKQHKLILSHFFEISCSEGNIKKTPVVNCCRS